MLALGSGAVLDPDIQHRLEGLPVVYLAADFATIARRTGLDRPRVVIPGNPRGRLRACWGAPPALRELATVVVETDDLDPDEVAAEISARLSNDRDQDRRPALGRRPPYPVVVGVGVLGELPGLIPKHAQTVAVIHPEGLGEIARPACGALRRPGSPSKPSPFRTASTPRPSTSPPGYGRAWPGTG